MTYIAVFILGLISGPLSIYLFKKIPITAFCDYDETPTDDMIKKLDRYNTSKPFSKRGLCFGLCFSVIYCLLLLANGFNLGFLGMILTVLPLFLLSAADIKFYIIPDRFLICLFACPLIIFIQTFTFSSAVFYTDWYSPLLGGLVGGGFLFLTDIIGKLIYKKEAIGGGDMKLCFVLGLILGLKLTVALLFITLFLAGGYSVVMLIRKKLDKSQYLPLGPFICLAFLIICCLKNQLIMIIDTYFLFL